MTPFRSSFIGSTLLPATATLLLSSLCGAQVELQCLVGNTLGDTHGWSVSGVGDINGDGHDDVVVGAPGVGTGSMDWTGAAIVYCGLTGTEILTIEGEASMDFFGFSVAGPGDLNGDGIPDIAVGAYRCDAGAVDAGKVSAYSGSDGALLYQVSGDAAGDLLGHDLASLGDVNGDGVSDLAIGVPGSNSNGNDAGLARVISGANGAVLFDVAGNHSNAQLGFGIGAAKDVNGDGIPDLIAGAPFELNGVDTPGAAHVFSGINAALLMSLTYDEDGAQYGFSVAGLGDLNGDGRSELIVGAPKSKSERGEAFVYNGANGSEIHAFEGEANLNWLGDAVGTPGDVNGDGVPDIIFSSIRNYTNGLVAGKVTIHSGANGTELMAHHGEVGSYTGESVAACGDTNGDGVDDFIVGSRRGAGNHGTALIMTLTGCTAPTTYCDAVPNSTGVPASIHWHGSTSISAGNFILKAENGPIGQAGIFFYGHGQATTPYGGGIVCIDSATGLWRVTPVLVFSTGGDCNHALDFSNPPAPGGQIQPGSSWNFQFWYRDPASGHGFNFSNALKVNFCP